jgi:hypothetical protein
MVNGTAIVSNDAEEMPIPVLPVPGCDSGAFPGLFQLLLLLEGVTGKEKGVGGSYAILTYDYRRKFFFSFILGNSTRADILFGHQPVPDLASGVLDSDVDGKVLGKCFEMIC